MLSLNSLGQGGCRETEQHSYTHSSHSTGKGVITSLGHTRSMGGALSMTIIGHPNRTVKSCTHCACGKRARNMQPRKAQPSGTKQGRDQENLGHPYTHKNRTPKVEKLTKQGQTQDWNKALHMRNEAEASLQASSHKLGYVAKPHP